MSEIRESFNNDSDSDSHILNEVCLINNEISNFNGYRDVSSDETRKIVLSFLSKSCLLDPIPTTLLFQCLDSLIDIITSIINQSLRQDKYQHVLKKSLLVHY